MYQNAIIRAARQLTESGSALRMSEVAARAGVSRATLYRAFPSRRALLDALRSDGIVVADPDVESRAIDAMRRLLLRDGFQGLTMESVASGGGLSLATVYRRFGDRAGLLRTFMRHGDKRASLVNVLDRPVRNRDDLEQALTAFTESTLAALEEHRAFFLLAFSAPEEIKGAIRKIRDARRGTIAALAAFLRKNARSGLLAEGDERTLAALYMGQMLATALLLPESGEDMPPLPRLAASMVRLFLRGVLR